MQQSLTLPLASGRGLERAAPARIAVDIADRGLAAVLMAELALTPGLALVRPGDRADVAITDRPERAEGRRMLSIAGKPEAPLGPRVSVVPSRDARLITAATLLLAAGYRLEAEPSPAETFAPAGSTTLTARERQVAELLVEGASNKVIARRLDISVHTAKFHVAAVLEKLHARNRSDAVAIALRDGLVAL
ncbi:MAG: helix-turn-helix transcriptional regulator [Devosia sp.]|nr:helix-turn-helix transcriptional regulator [Devosia sp.]